MDGSDAAADIPWLSVVHDARALPLSADSVRTLSDRPFDGPSAAGKNTQIALVPAAVNSTEVVAVIDNRGGGTAIGDSLRQIFRVNLHDHHPHRWHTDFLLKVATWALLRSSVPMPLCPDATLVLCNRSLLSQVVYSSISMADPGILDSFCMAESWREHQDVNMLLLPTMDVIRRRVSDRVTRGEKALRIVDSPQFVSQAIEKFHYLAAHLSTSHIISPAGSPEEVHATVCTC